MKKLIVIRFKAKEGQTVGDLIRKSTKKEGWGSMLVMEESLVVENGIINKRKRVAAIRAKLPELEALGLNAGDDFNQKMLELGGKEHRIVYTETTAPQYEGHKPKINPQTKGVMLTNGQPIFLSASVELASVEDDCFEEYAEGPVVESGAAAKVA